MNNQSTGLSSGNVRCVRGGRGTTGRSQHGGAMAFSAAGIIFAVAVGIAFILVGKILGGSRELQNSTDSAGLAIARDAAFTGVELPSATGFQSGVGAPGSAPYDNFHLLVEEQPWIRGAEQSEAQRSGSQQHPVKLENYNFLSGQSLLVALNSQSLQDYAHRSTTSTGAHKEVGDAPIAKTHAEWLTDALQGQDGMGKRLGDRLRQFNKEAFEKFANANSVRMAGLDSTVKSENTETLVSYVDQSREGQPDVNVTNLEVTEDLAEQIPEGLLVQRNTTSGETKAVSASKKPDAGFKMYLRGYTDYRGTAASGQFNFTLPVTVPLEPEGLAHLVSKKTFEQDQTLADSSIERIKSSIPPNAFASLAKTTDKTANRELRTITYAKTGPRNEFFMSIPYGYIEVCNGYVNPQDPAASLRADRFTVFHRDPSLPKVGEKVFVYRLGGNSFLYSRNKGSLDRAVDSNVGGAPLNDADLGQIFLSSGFSASRDMIGLMKQPGAVFQVTLTEPPADGDLSETRFPNVEDRDNRLITASLPYGDFRTEHNNLTAMENYVKLINEVFLQYGKPGELAPKLEPRKAFTPTVRASGIKINKNGAPDQGLFQPGGATDGVYTQEATVFEILNHVFQGSAEANRQLQEVLYGPQGLYAKIHQIKPEATSAEIDALLGVSGNAARKLTIDGERYFIVMEDPFKKSADSSIHRHLRIYSATEFGTANMCPPGRYFFNDGKRAAQVENPDGGIFTSVSFTRPRHFFSTDLFNVRDLDTPPDFASMLVRDTAQWTPGSGFNNFLGRLELYEQAHGCVYNGK
jgi:hypothetical protein